MRISATSRWLLRAARCSAEKPSSFLTSTSCRARARIFSVALPSTSSTTTTATQVPISQSAQPTRLQGAHSEGNFLRRCKLNIMWCLRVLLQLPASVKLKLAAGRASGNCHTSVRQRVPFDTRHLVVAPVQPPLHQLISLRLLRVTPEGQLNTASV